MASPDFFNQLFGGFPALPDNPPRADGPKPQVTIEELVLRRVSHVRLRGRVYRIEVSELEPTKGTKS